MSTNRNPLLEVAVSYIPENTVELNQEEMNEVKQIFQSFIDGQIDYNEAQTQILKYLPNSQPLDKLKTILDVDDHPIPLSPEQEEVNSNSRKKTRTWTTAEDNRLLKAIHKLGLENWNEVSLFVGNGRTRSQCSQRWIRVLDPRISKSNWTKQEENKLIELVLQYGEKSWAKVSSMMGNRSDVQCRYRYQQIPKSQIMQFQKEGPTSSPEINPSPKEKTEKSQLSAKAKSTLKSLVLPSLSNGGLTIPQINLSVTQTPNDTSDSNLTDSSSSLLDEQETSLNDQISVEQPDFLVLPDDFKLEDRIPLSTSFLDPFKSEQLFDSSFWTH